MRNQYRFTRPSKMLMRPGIKLDNFSLVTANLMQDMSTYQTLSDSQPKGTAVMVLPFPSSSLKRVYAAIARVLIDRGKNVKVYFVRAQTCSGTVETSTRSSIILALQSPSRRP